MHIHAHTQTHTLHFRAHTLTHGTQTRKAHSQAPPLSPLPPPAPLDRDNAGSKKEWRNPFLPYEEALWVSHLSDSHTLLLNKFNVVAHHTLVVTRAFESQQDPLNASDLGATWQVLQVRGRGRVQAGWLARWLGVGAVGAVGAAHHNHQATAG